MIVDELEFNPSTGDLEDVGGGDPIYDTNGLPILWILEAVSQVCPTGYTNLGTCPLNDGFSSYNSCMQAAIGTFASQNQGVGNVNTYIINNAIFSATICASSSSNSN